MIRQRPVELLAPARNVECDMASVDHGADAVYIGAPRFGARASAGGSLWKWLTALPPKGCARYSSVHRSGCGFIPALALQNRQSTPAMCPRNVKASCTKNPIITGRNYHVIMSILNHFFDYKPEVLALDEKAMELCQPYFRQMEEIRDFNQLKML